jgi:beta-glucosidase
MAGDGAASGELAADVRARQTEAQMTDEERFSLLLSVMGANSINPTRDPRIPDGTPMSAGYVPGVARLGVPPLLMTDASLGVTNPGYRPGDTATALPAALALGASFNPELARQAGQMLGREARSRGFNVLLGGGMNLTRDVRNGRNFEYISEDPLLTGTLAAQTVAATQAEGVISTVKHFSLNCNETNRHWLDAVIDPIAHRESDLLAFEIAVESGCPGAVMSGYNKINGVYAGANDVILNEVLKGAWGYRGWVMSDWGATPSWEFALHGLDQESGAQIDALMWGAEPFDGPLKTAFAEGKLPPARLSDMVRRILRAIYQVGVDRWGPPPAIDMNAHHHLALQNARQGMVLLKNDKVLPLAPETRSVAAIGGFGHLGVPTGTGSSAVTPPGGFATVVPIGGPGIMGDWRNLYLLPTSPVTELKRRLPEARIEFDPGINPTEAATLARRCDVAVVFGIRVEGEGFDLPDLTLPWGQDAVIDAVAAANPNTIVVLETGSPVVMPWCNRVKGIVQAWYPGQAGGQAIAELLTGEINPSGRLPITFPSDLGQTPRPELPGLDTPWGTATTIEYHEGAEVGHRWYAKTQAAPLYAFGHGLSYTHFTYTDLEATGGATLTATFSVTNTGDRAGADVPQLYLIHAAGERRMRLLGFQRLELSPGESRRVTITAEPRLLARYDGDARQWRIAPGTYQIALAKAADDFALTARTTMPQLLFGS